MATMNTCNCETDGQGQELQEHGTSFFPAACYHNDLKGAPVQLHWHDELEAGIVAAGAVLLRIGSTCFRLQAGDGFFINAGVLHAAEAAEDDGAPCILQSLVFHPKLISGSMDNVFWHKYIHPLLSNELFPGICFLNSAHSAGEQVASGKKAHSGWRQQILTSYDTAWHSQSLTAIAAAWDACSREAYGYEFAVREHLSRLISLLHQHQGLFRQWSPEKDLRDNSRAKLMIQYIQDHYREPISLEEIAASASISESELFRCFHTVIGTTPASYLKQYRLQQAARLLLTTDWKIMEIGQHCCFQEMSYFAKAFRRAYGRSPSAYRKLAYESGKETDPA